MLSGGQSELPAGEDDPFLTDDDLSEAMVDSDEDDDEDAGSSFIGRWSQWPFCRGEVSGRSAALTADDGGGDELPAMAVSSSSAPRSTSSQPSNSLLPRGGPPPVDGGDAWGPAGAGLGVGDHVLPVELTPVVGEELLAVAASTLSNNWSRL